MSIFIIIDIDTILINFLSIDDLRCLYQANKYYYGLIKPRLQDYINFYKKVAYIVSVSMNKNNTLFIQSIYYGKLEVCKYNYMKNTPLMYFREPINILKYCFDDARLLKHYDIAKWIHSEAVRYRKHNHVSPILNDFAHTDIKKLIY